MSGIVRSIKTYHHTQVSNALLMVGYRWHKPQRRPTNIEVMLMGVPRYRLIEILNILQKGNHA